MDFYQLYTFYHVANHMNFTRAAEELNISQPAVSRQIESLEQSLGLKLFHRVGRSISLTDAGKTLFHMSEQILSLVEKTKSVMEGMKNLESGSLKIGASTTIGNYFLAPRMIKFAERYPGVRINLEIDSSTQVLHQLKQNSLDLAICSEPISEASFFMEPFLQDELVLAVPPKHALLAKETVRLDDLRQEKFLLRTPGSNTRHMIEKHFRDYAADLPLHTVELHSTEAIKQAIVFGAGISFLPKRAIEYELQAGAIHLIDGEELRPTRQFYIVHQKGIYPSPAVLMFTSFLKKLVT